MAWILLLSISLSLMMSGYVLSTPFQNSKAKIYFFLLLLAKVSLMIELALYDIAHTAIYNFLVVSGPMSASISILFYLYLKSSMELSDKLTLKNMTHLIIPLFYLLIVSPYGFLDLESKMAFHRSVNLAEDITWPLSMMPVRSERLFILSILGAVYLFLSWRTLICEINNKKNDVMKEVRRFSPYFLVLSACFILAFLFFVFRLPHSMTWVISCVVITVTCINCIIFYQMPMLGKKKVLQSITLPELPMSTDIKSYRSSVTPEYSQAIMAALKELLIAGAYQDSSLSLEVLSKKLNVSKHHLSQIINEQSNGNYFDLINEYRINAAKTLLQTSHLKIIDVAYEVGYNSKSTFYNEFKRRTEKTPSQYKTESDVSNPSE